MVVEVSSFQLDTIDTFRPGVSVILNITPDHLDRYDGMSGLCREQGADTGKPDLGGDIAVLNGNDPEIQPDQRRDAAGPKVVFQRRRRGKRGASFRRSASSLQTGGRKGHVA